MNLKISDFLIRFFGAKETGIILLWDHLPDGTNANFRVAQNWERDYLGGL